MTEGKMAYAAGEYVLCSECGTPTGYTEIDDGGEVTHHPAHTWRGLTLCPTCYRNRDTPLVEGNLRAVFTGPDRVEISCGYDSLELSVRDLGDLRSLCERILERVS